MATQNATITSSWSKIADSGDSALLIQASGYIEWQVAAMASESAPSVEGHTISGRDRALSRALIGDGHVYEAFLVGCLNHGVPHSMVMLFLLDGLMRRNLIPHLY